MRTAAHERWYKLPILWLGAAILLTSIAGCVLMVVLGSRYPDEPLPAAGEQLLKMPTFREPESPQ